MLAVAIGDPFNGVELYGPFEDPEEAIKYAELTTPKGQGWWVVSLEPPEWGNSSGNA